MKKEKIVILHQNVFIYPKFKLQIFKENSNYRFSKLFNFVRILYDKKLILKLQAFSRKMDNLINCILLQ